MGSKVERQLEIVQQITHIGSWEWDTASGTFTWSDELYRIYGLAPRSREITFDVYLSFVHPEDRDRVSDEIRAALLRGGRFAHRERIVRPDGSVRELDTVGEITVAADGTPSGLIGTCRDITAELRRDERLRLIETLVRGELPWTGDEGYKKAEVTGGGVALGEVHPLTMESRRHGGLYLCGEVLDAFGPIGGYNFLWAWATGRAAGLGAARGA